MSDRFLRLVAAATVMCAMFVSAAPAGATTTTFYLDTHNATDATLAFCSGANLTPPLTPPGCGSAVTAPVVFTSGGTYTVTVVGAISAWGPWAYRRCGRPEPSSEFGSAGITSQPTGDDAQFRFSQPIYTGKCPKLPKKTFYFQVDLGSGWFHPIALNNPKHPSGDQDKAHDQHPYTFTFLGQGVAPQFRFVDYHPSDNSGSFRITVSG